MKTTTLSAEAKARLLQAAKDYTPPVSPKYQLLEEAKQTIVELRAKKASYHTITTLLRTIADFEVSHQTVARFCRETLGPQTKRKNPKRSEKKSDPVSFPTSMVTPTATDPGVTVSPIAPPEPAKPTTQSEALFSLQSEPVPTGASLKIPTRTRGPRIANLRMLPLDEQESTRPPVKPK